MKNILNIIALLFIAPILANAQSSLNSQWLLYIKYYPIKTEDGCSFFSDSESMLAKKKYLLIITNPHTAYMQVKDNTFVYFTKVDRIKSQFGYTDFYKGKSGHFELAIKSIEKLGTYSTYRIGTLHLSTIYVKETIPIYGTVEDYDSYSH